MPIQPFRDRPEVDINKKHRTTNNVAPKSKASGDMYATAQGVSLRSFGDANSRLLPFMSSNGFPNGASERIDFSIEQTTYGIVQFFSDSDNDIDVSAYNDISTLNNPVAFIYDSGITAYPQVMLSPNWLDPGMMNGIIEPLEVRGTLPGTSIDSPFVAHTIRASTGTGDSGLFVSQYSFHNFSNLTRSKMGGIFIDSQDIKFKSLGLKLQFEGISDFGHLSIAPYDDSRMRLRIVNDLKDQDESDFNDFIGLGIISTMVNNSCFDYSRDKSISRGKTGIRNVSNVNSLAFGGLMK